MMSRSLAPIPVCLGVGSYRKLRCARWPVTGETLVYASYLPLSTARACLSTVSDRPSTRSQPCCTCPVLPLWVYFLLCIPLPNDGCRRRGQRCECYHSFHSDSCRIYGAACQTGPSFDAHQGSLQSKGTCLVPSLWAMTLTGWYGANPFP